MYLIRAALVGAACAASSPCMDVNYATTLCVSVVLLAVGAVMYWFAALMNAYERMQHDALDP